MTEGESDVINGLDELITYMASRTVSLLPEGNERTLAVYYFTSDGEVNDLSDYLINGLTTEMAGAGKGRVKMVSRQALDRVHSEGTFQMSSLVDEKEQGDIGKLLGADLILTGFITPLNDIFKLNAQLIEVETGVVLNGFIVDFTLPDELGAMIEKPDEVSEIIKVENKYIETGGAATATTIFEDFEGVIAEITGEHFEESWGDRIIYTDGTVSLEEGASVYRFTGEIDVSNILDGFTDSSANYYFTFPLKRRPEDFDGFSFSIKPEGFSLAGITVTQKQGNETYFFSLPVRLIEGEQNDLKIPFKNFQLSYSGKIIEKDAPVTIGVVVPFYENFEQYYFRNGNNIEGAVYFDNLGFYKVKGEEDGAVLEHFEDDIRRAVFNSRFEGGFLYVDYSESDSGVLKINNGVTGQTLRQTILEDGPSGRYLNITVSADINSAVSDYYEDWQELYLVSDISIPGNWTGYDVFSFLIRSDILEKCHVTLADEIEDIYYYLESDLSIGASWTKVNIAFEDFLTDGGSLADRDSYPGRFFLRVSSPIAERKTGKAVAAGKLSLSLDLDEFVLERR